MRNYKKVITIGHHIDGIFKLPCVISCNKLEDGRHYYLVSCVNRIRANIGDKLCQDHDGMWWVEKGGENGVVSG